MSRAKFIFAAALLALLTACTAAGQVNIITTVAGGGVQNNIAGTLANLSYTGGLAVDRNNNVYFTSAQLCQVYKLNPSGQMFLVAGTGICGFSGNGGPAASAQLNYPSSLALDGAGNLFIADTNTERVRRVDAATQIITTVAGNGGNGYAGDGGSATAAQLQDPEGVAVDATGNIFIADTGNNRIRRVDAQTQNITTVAGTGTAGFNSDNVVATQAELNAPRAVAVDSAGDLIIADTNNNRIRFVNAASQQITTVAGNGTLGYSGDGVPATSAEICYPYAVFVDGSGDLYIADSDNQRIRYVDFSTKNISTVAGNGIGGFNGDGIAATSAKLYIPGPLALDSAGNLFFADIFNFRVRRVDAVTAVITTVAGGGSGGDNGPATGGQLATPSAVAVDSAGDLFIADTYSARVRSVDAATQIITTVAGTGLTGYSGEGGPGNSGELSFPQGVAVDSGGNLFIADTLNERVRRVDAATQIITTVAGTGMYGYNGDGLLATAAELNSPAGLALDGAGNLFIADSANNRIRRVDATTQDISTVAGTGTLGYTGDGGLATQAELNDPRGVAVDGAENLFIADSINQRIRRVDASTGMITTYAGGGSGASSNQGAPATQATFGAIGGVGVDSSGNVFIADCGLSHIYRVDVLTHLLDIVAGNGSGIFSGDGGPATLAELDQPTGVTMASSGDLFIADQYNNRIRQIALPPFVVSQPGTLAFGNQNLGSTSATQAVTITNTGVVPLIIASIAPSAGFAESDNCGAPVSPLASCTINVSFAPTISGAQTGDLTVTDNSFSSPEVISLSGSGVGPVASVASPTLTFPAELVGQSASAQAVTLSNTGNASLTVSSITASANFGQTNNCGASVAAGGSCTINVTFTPTAGGSLSGTLTIIDNSNAVTGSTQTVSLSGEGVVPVASVASSLLTFPAELVGQSASAQAVTLSNTGTASLTVSSITASANFSQTNNCGASVAAGGSCSINVTFTPTTGGSLSGTLSITDNSNGATGSTQTVSLSGEGQDFSVGTPAGSSASATVAPGSPATYPLSVGSLGGMSGTVSFTCTGAPSGATCTVSPNPAAPGTNVTVTVNTTAPSELAPRKSPPPARPGPQPLLLLAVLMACITWTLAARRPGGASRTRLVPLQLAAGLSLALALAGCGGGGGGGNPTPSNPGTPAGTYTLTVTGTVGSGSTAVSHSMKLTLTVS
jgi:sugar lactone lactonase YvrE